MRGASAAAASASPEGGAAQVEDKGLQRKAGKERACILEGSTGGEAKADMQGASEDHKR